MTRKSARIFGRSREQSNYGRAAVGAVGTTHCAPYASRDEHHPAASRNGQAGVRRPLFPRARAQDILPNILMDSLKDLPSNLAGNSPGGGPAAETSDAAEALLSRLVTAYIATNDLGTRGRDAVVTSLLGLLGAMERQRETLRDIVSADHFRLFYQPIVRIEDRCLHHHEALLRLDQATAELAGDTDLFTKRIEAVGLSEALDLAVCGKALSVLNACPTAVIAVNVSGRSMQSEPFRMSLLGQLSHAQRLIVEITETAEITDIKMAARSIHLLRDQGVRVCLDDFGSGYAAFRYLRELPIDFLKIDGSYVSAAMTDARERDFVAAMCSLARSAGAEVIAEQIETEEQAALMVSLGATYGQGWLLGRPREQTFLPA